MSPAVIPALLLSVPVFVAKSVLRLGNNAPFISFTVQKCVLELGFKDNVLTLQRNHTEVISLSAERFRVTNVPLVMQDPRPQSLSTFGNRLEEYIVLRPQGKALGCGGLDWLEPLCRDGTPALAIALPVAGRRATLRFEVGLSAAWGGESLSIAVKEKDGSRRVIFVAVLSSINQPSQDCRGRQLVLAGAFQTTFSLSPLAAEIVFASTVASTNCSPSFAISNLHLSAV